MQGTPPEGPAAYFGDGIRQFQGGQAFAEGEGKTANLRKGGGEVNPGQGGAVFKGCRGNLPQPLRQAEGGYPPAPLEGAAADDRHPLGHRYLSGGAGEAADHRPAVGGEEQRPLHPEPGVLRVELPAAQALAPGKGSPANLPQLLGEKEALQALTVPEGAGLDGGKPLGQLELLKGAAAAEGTMANFQLLQPLRQTDLP